MILHVEASKLVFWSWATRNRFENVSLINFVFTFDECYAKDLNWDVEWSFSSSLLWSTLSMAFEKFNTKRIGLFAGLVMLRPSVIVETISQKAVHHQQFVVDDTSVSLGVYDVEILNQIIDQNSLINKTTIAFQINIDLKMLVLWK